MNSPKHDNTNIPVGIAWILLTVICFVSLDTLTKYLTESYPIAQVVWARFFFHVVILAAVFNRRLIMILKSYSPIHQLGRSALMLTLSVLTVFALKYIPLANLCAIMLTGPIFVTALSVPLLGEKVGIHRWVSVLAGFTGALIIIRPGSDLMDPIALVVLVCAFFYAIYQISTRILTRRDSVITTLTYSGVVGAVGTSFWVPFHWQTPDFQGWLLFASLGGIGAMAHFFMTRAYSMAPPVVISPFGYTSMVWATLFGYVLFGDLPDQMTVLGSIIIISSGLYILYREWKIKKKASGIKEAP